MTFFLDVVSGARKSDQRRIGRWMPKDYLPFEKEIYELEEVLARLESMDGGQGDVAEEIRRIRRELVNLKKKIYSALTPWQTIQVSRHKNRPLFMDYVDLIFDDFVELHGDRAIGDDRAIRCGFARLGDFRVVLIGHQKGRTLKEKQECFYGCATRKAIAKR